MEWSGTEGIGGKGGVFPEKIGEMGDFFKTQAPGYFGNAPVGLLQKNFRFLYNPGPDDFGSRFASALL